MEEKELLEYITNPEKVLNLKEITPEEHVPWRYYENRFYELDDKVIVLSMIQRRSSIRTNALIDRDEFNHVLVAAWYPHHEKTKPENLTYVYSSLGRRLHRHIMRCPKDKVIDHLNNYSLDCRKSNMRVCTVKENNQNISMSCRNTSGILGVSYRPERNAWVAQIVRDGKSYTKQTKNKEEAIKFRNEIYERFLNKKLND